jgi:hypothetical protein
MSNLYDPIQCDVMRGAYRTGTGNTRIASFHDISTSTSQLDLFWPANFRPTPQKKSAWDAYIAKSWRPEKVGTPERSAASPVRGGVAAVPAPRSPPLAHEGEGLATGKDWATGREGGHTKNKNWEDADRCV